MLADRGTLSDPGSALTRDVQPLPYRGTFGQPRPGPLDSLRLPPGPMPSHDGLRPLKAWRYVGVYGPELMLCVGAARIGRARQSFWAVWDRAAQVLHEHTALGRGAVALESTRVRVRNRRVQLDIELDETAGIETVCPTGKSYAWTRKQLGIKATGMIAIDGEPRTIDARAVIDDTAAYYERHTSWRWSAGVGTARDGRPVAWNLVKGVNDPPHNSERTVLLGGEAQEPPPSEFAADLTRVDGLTFQPEATRERRDNMLVIASSYRQPFGTFSGSLPGGVELAEGFGVMESHDARW
jgi:Protein of unknown function (DUF2804)